MNIRKKIAVITSSILSIKQRKVVLGIQEEAFKSDCDVLIFSSLIDGQDWNDLLEGEKNIYSLINYNKLDGIILLPDQLFNYEQTKVILNEIIKNAKCPIVSINYHFEGYPSLSTNTVKPMKSILEHLYKEHGVKDIAFVTGPKEHPHAIERLESFKSFIEKHNLDIKDNRIFYGDFWFSKGEEIVDSLINSKEGLPKAICCASEAMGLSVLEACEKRNIKVPEDIIVTGYDAEYSSDFMPFYLTSVIFKENLTGKNAVRTLLTQIDGIEREIEVQNDELFIGCTCGCTNYLMKSRHNIDFRKKMYEKFKGFFSEFNFMMEDGISAVSMEDCLWKIDWYTYYLNNFKSFSLCLNDDWLGYDRADKLFRSMLYSDKMILALKRVNLENGKVDKSISEERFFDTKLMLPSIWEEREKPSTFIFTPVHFQRKCFGYFVIEHDSPEIYPDYFWRWSRNLSNMLESMRRFIKLERINKELTTAYNRIEKDAVMDSLTGFYNRNAYNIYSKEQLALAVKENKDVLILAADMNNLKGINDTYGHSEGDYGLIESANALMFFQGIDGSLYERCYRMGGDEYCIVCIGKFTEQDVKERLKRVECYLNNINATSNKPFKVSLSLGYYLGGYADKDIDKLYQIADRKMYGAKHESKKDLAENKLKDFYI